MDCEEDGCSKKSTKNLTATFARGKGSIINLCDTHAVESKKDFIKLQKDPCGVHAYTFVVKTLS